MSKNYNDKIKGSIFGSIIGDSIGFLFEGHSQTFINNYLEKIKNNEIKKYFRGYNGNLNGPLYNLEKCQWFYNFGQYTDDSQLSLEIIDNVIKNQGIFNIKDYSFQILDLFENKKIVGYGTTTKSFTENLSRGINYKYCSKNSTSNGSVMRSDVFGLLFFNQNDNVLFDCVKKQSLLTHLNYKTLACSLTVAFTIKYIMLNINIENDMLLYYLYTKIKEINIDVANSILEMKQILENDFNIAFKMIKKYETIKWCNESLSSCSLTTLLWALYSFLKYKNSFEDCLISCLKVGGDVDTIAKIGCSFSGCYLGKEKLPTEYLYDIHDKKRKNYKSIKKDINNLCLLIKDKKINFK